mmetsp:Transcript_16900/g.68995  ORF Transcript_16900/g.68995 Transcript_16900/m.68995 type:complete len:91 (+) Transcript_16900:630-902(+)
MLACKYLEDLKFSLHHFAVIGGVTARELQELEVDMLMRLEFSLAVAPDELNAYRRRLADEVRRSLPRLFSSGIHVLPVQELTVSCYVFRL